MHHISRPTIYDAYNAYHPEGNACRFCGKRRDAAYYMEPCTGQCRHTTWTTHRNLYGR